MNKKILLHLNFLRSFSKDLFIKDLLMIKWYYFLVDFIKALVEAFLVVASSYLTVASYQVALALVTSAFPLVSSCLAALA